MGQPAELKQEPVQGAPESRRALLEPFAETVRVITEGRRFEKAVLAIADRTDIPARMTGNASVEHVDQAVELLERALDPRRQRIVLVRPDPCEPSPLLSRLGLPALSEEPQRLGELLSPFRREARSQRIRGRP